MMVVDVKRFGGSWSDLKTEIKSLRIYYFGGTGISVFLFKLFCRDRYFSVVYL